jgi:hypothetical protein
MAAAGMSTKAINVLRSAYRDKPDTCIADPTVPAFSQVK